MTSIGHEPPPWTPSWGSDDWPPGGYRAVWKRPGNWKPSDGVHTCRDRQCQAIATMAMDRGVHRNGKRWPSWWHYCADHSFRRVLHDGVVWEPGIEPIEPPFQVNPEPLAVVEIAHCRSCRRKAPWCSCGKADYA